MAAAVGAELRVREEVGHSSEGTNYGDDGITKYAKITPCSDLERFLNLHIREYLKEAKVNGKQVIDIGCGLGPWSICAAQMGATVLGIDLQEGMICAAKKAALVAGCHINFEQGDAARLKSLDGSFDCALSINVGCNLPRDTFQNHFNEMMRVLKKGGTALISAPFSLDVLFTDGSRKKNEIQGDISALQKEVNDKSDPKTIQKKINDIQGIVSATFAFHEGKLSLVAPGMIPPDGSEIWRKLSKVTLPNRYYSESCYLKAFESAGLKVRKIVKDKFATEEEREQFNTGETSPRLGTEYVANPPFVLYIVEKS
jgi:ubiquinone/menaquinone biosynthesis C-methylase UbiE